MLSKVKIFTNKPLSCKKPQEVALKDELKKRISRLTVVLLFVSFYAFFVVQNIGICASETDLGTGHSKQVQDIDKPASIEISEPAYRESIAAEQREDAEFAGVESDNSDPFNWENIYGHLTLIAASKHFGMRAGLAAEIHRYAILDSALLYEQADQGAKRWMRAGPEISLFAKTLLGKNFIPFAGPGIGYEWWKSSEPNIVEKSASPFYSYTMGLKILLTEFLGLSIAVKGKKYSRLSPTKPSRNERFLNPDENLELSFFAQI